MNYEDKGCKAATTFLSRQSKCQECPFRDCIYSLKHREKQLILTSHVIQIAFNCYDHGMTINKVAKHCKTPEEKVKYWLDNRNKIEAKTNRYGTRVLTPV